jgi:hypothetical protein
VPHHLLLLPLQLLFAFAAVVDADVDTGAEGRREGAGRMGGPQHSGLLADTLSSWGTE